MLRPIRNWSAFTGRDFTPQPFQTVQGLVKRFVLFGKVEADQMFHRLLEETGARDGPYAHFTGQVFAEFQVAVIAELRDVHQDVVRAFRYVMNQIEAVQAI